MDAITIALSALKAGAAAWGARSPAITAFLEKMSTATGILVKPWQTRRDAQADADATIIKAKGDAESSIIKAEAEQKIKTLEGRAELRIAAEQQRSQTNIENIVGDAITNIREDAKPNQIDDDWLANFFDKSRLFSDKDMQRLWSQVLAGEANSPGSFSRRTVNLLANLDKEDALSFRKICSLSLSAGNGVQPLVFKTEGDFYESRGLNFDTLQNLDSIGLIKFESLYTLVANSSKIAFNYFSQSFIISTNANNALNKDNIIIGGVFLTKVGVELANICQPEEDKDFLIYVLEHWRQKGYQIEYTQVSSEAS